MRKPPIFRQLFDQETSTYTYLLADPQSKEAVLIDPVYEQVERDLNLVRELGLTLKYVVDTHVHADHITGSGELRRLTGAKSAVSVDGGVQCIDVPLGDGDELEFGPYKLKAISTPGHTDSCMSYHVDDMVFTGDTLLIRGCGRTDFQQGSPKNLFHSVREKIFMLPDETKVFPGHDYKGLSQSSIGEEKKFNPRLGLDKSEEEFTQIMMNLKLDNPKKIHEAVPANLACGQKSPKAH